MQFVKFILVAMSIELLCCFGLIEKEKPSPKPDTIIIEQVIIDQSAEGTELPETAKHIPIHIKVQ